MPAAVHVVAAVTAIVATIAAITSVISVTAEVTSASSHTARTANGPLLLGKTPITFFYRVLGAA